MSPTRRRLSTLAFVVLILAFAAFADAQDRVGITLAAGAITNVAPSPNEDFVEPSYLFSVQRVMKRYFVLEGDVNYWSHVSSFDQGPHTISGPSGVIGTVQGSNETSDTTNWVFGLNFLVRSTGPVHVFGGGGVGFIMQDEVYSQQEFGCSAGLDPRTCVKYQTTYNRGPLPLFRLLGGVEVPVSSRIAIVGTARYEDASWEGRSQTVNALAGVRFSLK